MKIFVREGQFFADGFALRRSFRMNEGDRRMISFLSDKGCGYAVISLERGELLIKGDTIEAIYWKEGVELRPRPYSLITRAIKEFSPGELLFRIECTCASRCTISVSGAASGRWECVIPIHSPSIRLIEGQRIPIAEISAYCDEGQYLAMIALSDREAKMLLEDRGESIHCHGNEVKVRRALHDSRERMITTLYLWQGEGFQSSREIICAKEHTFIREEMGRHLLECVLARDENSALELLSPELSDAKMIFDYFGEITSVTSPLMTISPTAVAAIRIHEGRKTASVYDFDFDADGRISNVRCSSDESDA